MPNLALLAKVAQSRALQLGTDATRWHRVYCRCRDLIRQQSRQRKRLERKTAVAVPMEVCADHLEETDDDYSL